MPSTVPYWPRFVQWRQPAVQYEKINPYAIIAAGPVANFIFAIFAYWLVFIIGVPGVRPVIGEITPNSIAAQAQIALP
ncbi:Membrane-associated zinc metalloprotease, partial [Salmonella enterica subsp. enterica serovar Montevideo str. S5-403]